MELSEGEVRLSQFCWETVPTKGSSKNPMRSTHAWSLGRWKTVVIGGWWRLQTGSRLTDTAQGHSIF